MHAQVKHAWFIVIVVGAASLLAAAAYLVALAFVDSSRALGAIGFFGFTGFLGFGGIFYRNRRGEKGVVMDERDVQIGGRAALFSSLLVAFLYWGAVCMMPWFWVVFRRGIDAAETVGIPVFWLPILYGASGLVFWVAWSAYVLARYGLGGRDNEG